MVFTVGVLAASVQPNGSELLFPSGFEGEQLGEIVLPVVDVDESVYCTWLVPLLRTTVNWFPSPKRS